MRSGIRGAALVRVVLVLAVVLLATLLVLWIGGWIHAPETVTRGERRGESLVLVTVEDLRADHLHGVGYARRTTPALFAIASRGSIVPSTWLPSPDPGIALEAILRARRPGEVATADGGVFADRRALVPDWGAFLAGTVAADAADRVGLAVTMRFDDSRLATTSAMRWIRSREGRPFTAWIHARVPPVRSPDRPSLFAAGAREPSARLVGDYDDRLRELDEVFADLYASLERAGLLESTLLAIVGVSAPIFAHEEPFGRGAGEGLDPVRLRVPAVFTRANALPEFSLVEGNLDAIDFLPTALALLGESTPATAEGRSRSGRVREGGTLDPMAIPLRGLPDPRGRLPVGIVREDRLVVRIPAGRVRHYRVVPGGRGAVPDGSPDSSLERTLDSIFPR